MNGTRMLRRQLFLLLRKKLKSGDFIGDTYRYGYITVEIGDRELKLYDDTWDSSYLKLLSHEIQLSSLQRFSLRRAVREGKLRNLFPDMEKENITTKTNIDKARKDLEEMIRDADK